MSQSNLKARLQEEIKTAMKSQQAERLGTLRLLLAAIKQREVDERIMLDDTQIVAVLEKMIKQRNESIAQYQQGKREDLVRKEQAEITILQEFMPPAMDEAEVDALIKTAISSTGAASIKDMGKVMAQLKPQIQGRADMGVVSEKIKKALSA